MRLLKVLKQPKFLLIAIISSLLMLAVYVFSQLLGAIQNINVWIATIPLHNAILLGVFIALFGITFSYQLSLWFGPKICSTTQKLKGSGSSSLGTIVPFFVAQCPACASLAALFLPISALPLITKFSLIIMIASISLLAFTLNYLGAFKKE